MAKKKRRRPLHSELSQAPTISNLPENISGWATTDPAAASGAPTAFLLIHQDSTNAEIGHQEERQSYSKTYVQTYAGLADKLLEKMHGIYVFGVLAACSVAYLFYQDNSAGLLKDWTGIIVFIKKAGVLMGSFLTIALLCFLGSRGLALFKKRRQASAS